MAAHRHYLTLLPFLICCVNRDNRQDFNRYRKGIRLTPGTLSPRPPPPHRRLGRDTEQAFLGVVQSCRSAGPAHIRNNGWASVGQAEVVEPLDSRHRRSHRIIGHNHRRPGVGLLQPPVEEGLRRSKSTRRFCWNSSRPTGSFRSLPCQILSTGHRRFSMSRQT